MVSIGPRIQVDGEEEFRQQIIMIIQQSKTLKAEMRALTASFADNATEQEKATASSKLLNDQLEAARKRTELLQQMTQKAAETTGENSMKTLKWREALANAKEELAKCEGAARKNNEALEEQGEVTEEAGGKLTGLGDSIDSVAGKFGISIPDGAKKALNGVNGFSAGTVAKMGAAAAAVTAVVKVTKKLFDLTTEAAENADALLTRSAQTGLSTDLLQQLDYAQRFLDFDGLDKTLVKITDSIGKASDQYASYEDAARKAAQQGKDFEGSLGAQATAFDRLGVSIVDDNQQLRDSYDVWLDAIDALGQIENATERDTIANDLFGRGYSEMKPLINAGTDALQAYMEKAKENGIVIEREGVEKLGALDDAIEENNSKWDALKNKIAVEFAPTSMAAMDLYADAIEKADEAFVESGLLSEFQELVDTTIDWTHGLMNLFENLPSWMSPLYDLKAALETINGLMGAIGWVKDKVVETWNDAYGINTSNVVESFSDRFKKIPVSSVADAYKNLQIVPQIESSTFWTQQIGYNAAGTDNWRGGLTWVGELGPELMDLPRGTRIYSAQQSRQIAESRADVFPGMSGVERKLDRILMAIDAIPVRERMI